MTTTSTQAGGCGMDEVSPGTVSPGASGPSPESSTQPDDAHRSRPDEPPSTTGIGTARGIDRRKDGDRERQGREPGPRRQPRARERAGLRGPVGIGDLGVRPAGKRDHLEEHRQQQEPTDGVAGPAHATVKPAAPTTNRFANHAGDAPTATSGRGSSNAAARHPATVVNATATATARRTPSPRSIPLRSSRPRCLSSGISLRLRAVGVTAEEVFFSGTLSRRPGHPPG